MTIAGNTSGAVVSWSRNQAPGLRRTASQAQSAAKGTASVAVDAPRMSVFTIESRNEPGPRNSA